MRKFLLVFLLIIQMFFLCVNAGDASYVVKNFDKHVEYIQVQSKPQKKIFIDFKNYENAIILPDSNFQEVFVRKNSNTNDFFIGFSNFDFNTNFKNQKNLMLNIIPESSKICFVLKNQIYTRAP